MSIESANAFVDRMNHDEDFRNSVIGCRTAQERSNFVSSRGFTFNAEEVNTAKAGYTGDSISYEKYGCCTSPDWHK